MSSGINSIYSQDNINSPKSFNDGVYEFDRFRLDVAHLMLYENFAPVALAPKVVETLLALVERRGEVVSKNELMNRLWADSFVEESNLTQNIYLLRKTLGKGVDGRDLIETFRRRGYRFNGQIKKPSADLIRATAAGEQNGAREIARHGNGGRQNAYNSLAVLPLTNESGEDAIEYLSDGITESIINRLSQISQLRVLARNTVFSYKNQTVAPQEIGRRLGASAILTGRVLQLGERLIVRAELVETANGWQMWGEQYNRESSDILELQETIAREISENLQVN
jgi:TolB-like protein